MNCGGFSCFLCCEGRFDSSGRASSWVFDGRLFGSRGVDMVGSVDAAGGTGGVQVDAEGGSVSGVTLSRGSVGIGRGGGGVEGVD